MANFSAVAGGTSFIIVCTNGKRIEVSAQEQYQVFVRWSGQESYEQVYNLYSPQVNGEINMNNLGALRLESCMRQNLDQGGFVDTILLDDGSEIVIRTKNGYVSRRDL